MHPSRTVPIVMALAALSLTLQATAQEALRSSLAGQSAMDAKKQRMASGWGDIRLGPVNLDLSTQLELEGSDNVRFQDSDPDADLIIRPGFTARALWPVTDQNALSLSAGIGYNKYLDNSDLDYLYLTPGSDLAFDVYVGDFVINLHDRFHLTQDVASQPDAVGTYGRFENSIGTLVTWDLNKAMLTFNYDHLTYLVTDSDYDYVDHSSELFGLRSAWFLAPATPLGVELGFGTTDYDDNVLNDLLHYSAGAFFEMPSGRFSNLRLASGYVIYDPTSRNAAGSNGETSDAVYAELSFNHRITEQITYTLSGGQQMQAGVNAETLQMLFVRAAATWRGFRGITISPSLAYENGEEFGATSALGGLEKFSRYAAGISATKRLGEQLTTSLRYGFIYRDSDLKDRDYVQNRLVLNVTYSF